jgi:hypothetical protein
VCISSSIYLICGDDDGSPLLVTETKSVRKALGTIPLNVDRNLVSSTAKSNLSKQQATPRFKDPSTNLISDAATTTTKTTHGGQSVRAEEHRVDEAIKGMMIRSTPSSHSLAVNSSNLQTKRSQEQSGGMMTTVMIDAETSLKRDLGLREDEDLPEPEYMPPRDEEVWEPPSFGVFLKEHMDQFVEMYKRGRRTSHVDEVSSSRIDALYPVDDPHEDEIKFSRKLVGWFLR